MIKISKVNYKHNKDFYNKQYAKYVNLYNKTQRKTENQGYSMLSQMKSRAQFESAYKIYQNDASAEGVYSRGIVNEMVRDQTLGLKRHNASAFVKQINQLNQSGSGKQVSVQQIQHLTHSELTELYDVELLAAYYDAKASGMTAKGAKLWVSQVWFGSD